MHSVATAEQVTIQLAALTEELHQFLAKVHTARKRESDSEWLEAMRARCRELSDKASRAKQSATEAWVDFGEKWPKTRLAAASLSTSLDRMSASLTSMAQEMADSARWSGWKGWGQSLSVNYEELLRSVRGMHLPHASQALRLPHFKPLNFSRNAFHVGMGLLGLTMSLWVLTRVECVIIMLGMSLLVGCAEVSRAFSPRVNDFLINLPMFKYTIRPREMSRVNSASVFVWTLTGVCMLAPLAAVQVGLLVLTFADPAASLVGKRWGRIKLWKQKSVAGSSAFFIVAFGLSSLAFALIAGTDVRHALIAGAVVAGVASITEALSDRMDDNFTVLGMATGIAALFL